MWARDVRRRRGRAMADKDASSRSQDRHCDGEAAGPQARRSSPATPAMTVLVYSASQFHGELVCRVIAACGASASHVEIPRDLRTLACTAACSVAIFMLEGPPGHECPALDAIRVISGHGFKVISCACGIQQWRVSERCLPVLAGSVCLLAAMRPGFEEELGRLLRQLLTSQANEFDQAER